MGNLKFAFGFFFWLHPGHFAVENLAVRTLEKRNCLLGTFFFLVSRTSIYAMEDSFENKTRVEESTKKKKTCHENLCRILINLNGLNKSVQHGAPEYIK
jgi:hypothetical protein